MNEEEALLLSRRRALLGSVKPRRTSEEERDFPPNQAKLREREKRKRRERDRVIIEE